MRKNTKKEKSNKLEHSIKEDFINVSEFMMLV